MKKYRKGELAKAILLLAVAGGVVATVLVLPGMGIIFKLLKPRTTYERKRIFQAVKRMENNELLIRQIKNGVEKLVLTPKGHTRLTEYRMDDLKISEVKKWDGKWRILMFDIPEVKSKVRREVSFKIKDIGMKAIQDSVFVSPFPCWEQLEIISQHYFVKKYFIYFEADTYEGVDNLLQYFKLNK